VGTHRSINELPRSHSDCELTTVGTNNFQYAGGVAPCGGLFKFVQRGISFAYSRLLKMMLRRCQIISVSTSGQDAVVPIAMKLVSPELEL
jgi:hypothetical protein